MNNSSDGSVSVVHLIQNQVKTAKLPRLAPPEPQSPGCVDVVCRKIAYFPQFAFNLGLLLNGAEDENSLRCSP